MKKKFADLQVGSFFKYGDNHYRKTEKRNGGNAQRYTERGIRGVSYFLGDIEIEVDNGL